MSASPLVTVLLPVWNGASLPLTAEGEVVHFPLTPLTSYEIKHSLKNQNIYLSVHLRCQNEIHLEKIEIRLAA